MKEKAVNYFKNGYSCSESVVQAAIDKGYVNEDLLSAASSFSGGMGVRCLCGAVAGAQLVFGAMFGRKNNVRDGLKARALAKNFNEEFMKKYKVNCCKVLSAGFEFSSPERKQHCAQMVEYCAQLTDSMIKQEIAQKK